MAYVIVHFIHQKGYSQGVFTFACDLSDLCRWVLDGEGRLAEEERKEEEEKLSKAGAQ